MEIRDEKGYIVSKEAKNEITRLKNKNMTQSEENKKRLVVCEEIENTPFITIMTDTENETDYQLAIGTQLLSTKKFSTREKAIEHLNEKPWDILGAWMVAISRWTLNMHKEAELAKREGGK